MDLRLLRPSTFRALSSRRRVEILRHLAERPHTPAELARRLGVTEQTVQYHLDKLAGAGLAERRMDERRWAYHELTGMGRDVVADPPSTKPLAVLGLAGAALATGLAAIWASGRPEPLPPNSLASPAPEPWWLDLAIAGSVGLGVIAVIGIVSWLVARRALRDPDA